MPKKCIYHFVEICHVIAEISLLFLWWSFCADWARRILRALSLTPFYIKSFHGNVFHLIVTSIILSITILLSIALFLRLLSLLFLLLFLFSQLYSSEGIYFLHFSPFIFAAYLSFCSFFPFFSFFHLLFFLINCSTSSSLLLTFYCLYLRQQWNRVLQRLFVVS